MHISIKLTSQRNKESFIAGALDVICKALQVIIREQMKLRGLTPCAHRWILPEKKIISHNIYIKC